MNNYYFAIIPVNAMVINWEPLIYVLGGLA